MEIEELPVKKEFEAVLPLINIIFLLLIFFMLVGSFTQPDLFNVQLPAANATGQANVSEFTISMNANKQYAIKTQAFDEAALLLFIREKLDQQETLRVQLKADHTVKSTDLIATMEALGTTGLTSLHLLTTTVNSEGN